VCVFGVGHIHVAGQGHTVFNGQHFGHDADRNFGWRFAANVNANRASQSSPGSFSLVEVFDHALLAQ
jgi:hypothetical protein